MTKLRNVAAAFTALFGLLFATAALSNDCDALKAACKAAGFAAGAASSSGAAVGANCIDALVNGTKPPGDGKLALPVVSDDKIAACAAIKANGKAKTTGRKLHADALGPDIVAAGAKPVAPRALPAGAKAGPNIVLILVDDYSMNLMTTDNDVIGQSMPNLAKMQREGATFSNFFVTDSLCCPSRTSIFTGMFPHNSGVYTNTPPDGGFETFMSHGDDAKTFAVALHDQFYQTAMMGKYLNGYEPDQHGVPQGWSNWAVAGNAYQNFNYVLNYNGTLIGSPLHLTDKMSELGRAFIKQAATGPFLLELATFSPHGPYTPPARYAKSFADLTYPITPAYQAKPDDTAPKWLKEIPPITKKALDKMVEDFRNRVRSDKGIDDMIGAVRQELADLGLSDNTYVFFTSDNGYHMGEYSLWPGKQTPFDTDIHVPLVVVGPGIAAGGTIDDITMNIDFYPTFRELAGLPASDTADGHSLVAALEGKPGPRRNMAVVEHVHSGPKANNPDAQVQKSGDPPNYVALRLQDAMYVEYEGGEVGYYDLKTDPYELHNVAGTLTPERLKTLHEAAVANHACKGAAECGAAQNLTP